MTVLCALEKKVLSRREDADASLCSVGHISLVVTCSGFWPLQFAGWVCPELGESHLPRGSRVSPSQVHDLQTVDMGGVRYVPRLREGVTSVGLILFSSQRNAYIMGREAGEHVSPAVLLGGQPAKGVHTALEKGCRDPRSISEQVGDGRALGRGHGEPLQGRGFLQEEFKP